MGKFDDLTGKRFGRLLVIEQAPKRKGRIYWRCLCDCGNEIETQRNNLAYGDTKSCGCYRTIGKAKHGLSENSIYPTWAAMMSRCYNPNNSGYHNYGGRGIKVCKRWHDIETLYLDMGEKPEGHSIDRIDNDGDYCPENCRWATKKEQNRNRRDNVVLTYKGERKTLIEWAESLGMTYCTLYLRIRRGWSIERAFTQPPRGKHA